MVHEAFADADVEDEFEREKQREIEEEEEWKREKEEQNMQADGWGSWAGEVCSWRFVHGIGSGACSEAFGEQEEASKLYGSFFSSSKWVATQPKKNPVTHPQKKNGKEEEEEEEDEYEEERKDKDLKNVIITTKKDKKVCEEGWSPIP